jgi:GNAT superfamily N-acetyltransferase/predicted nucleotidyltransferase
MPRATRETVERLVEALVEIPNLVAVALGGSWARGTQRADSDVDLGLYYVEAAPVSQDAVRVVAERFDLGKAPVVTGLFEWGPWVIEEATRGEEVWDYAQTPVYGFHSLTYLGETEIAIPLHDPDGILGELKQRVSPYPPALKRTMIEKSLWGAEFTLSFARHFAARGDVYNTVGCLTRALGRLTQALFARNERYFLNDKGAVEVASRSTERVRGAGATNPRPARRIGGGAGGDGDGAGESLPRSRGAGGGRVPSALPAPGRCGDGGGATVSPGIEIRVNPRVSSEDVCALRESVGWPRLEEDYPAALDGYWGTVGAFDPERGLVGWCAILSDGVRHAVLIDVIVHPSRQRQGMGRGLVSAAVDHVRSHGIETVHVDFVEEIAPFYERCGFRIGLGGIYEPGGTQGGHR